MTSFDERCAEEIIAHLKDTFGVSVRDMLPIDKGWLNVKWKLLTDQETLFVKYYHPDRYKLRDQPNKKSAVEKTLQLQQGLSEAGVRCPTVYQSQGRFIQETPSGFLYTVQSWLDGQPARAGLFTEAQMLELGRTAGRMHQWLQSVPPLDQPAWKPDRDSYFREWQRNWDHAYEAGDQTVMGWLSRSRELVQAMDFRMFEACRTGWLHWDLWADNLLVQEHSLAGIVDFDRMAVAYQEIDVARAILSGALHEGQLRTAAVRAFLKGYGEYLEIPRRTLIRAMSMLYLIESIWWLRTEIRIRSGLTSLLGRFIEEMHWIEEHWEEMEDRLDNL